MSGPTGNRVPQSLLRPGMMPVWEIARRRLDRFGSQRRGFITLPVLDHESALTLESLLGRKSGRRLDLSRIETKLSALKVGSDLCEALTRLGHPPSRDAAEHRAARARSEAARAALVESAATWPEPWATAWADSVISSGLSSDLDGPAATALTADVRRLLDHLDHNTPKPRCVSRTEIAAVLHGSAHALDPGTKLAALTAHALRHRLVEQALRSADDFGEDGVREDAAELEHRESATAADSSCRSHEMSRVEALRQRELWEAIGVLTDRVSAPALTWGLPAIGGSALDKQIQAASAGHLPVHVNLFALRRHPIAVPPRSPVLVVENPRLVEAAAERSLDIGMVAANGNPSDTVTTLLDQLQCSGASLWYHGDFDAPGIAICRRMHDLGCTPWMMSAADYENAIRLARRTRTTLGISSKVCGPTPWDSSLETTFNCHRLIIHEEYVLDTVLNGFADRKGRT